MMHDAPERASFPVSPENTPTKRRAVFSASFAGLTSHHVQPTLLHPLHEEGGIWTMIRCGSSTT